MGGLDAFQPRGVPWQKALLQRGTDGGENLPAFLRVRVVRYLGIIFRHSEPPTRGSYWARSPRPCACRGAGGSLRLLKRLKNQTFWHDCESLDVDGGFRVPHPRSRPQQPWPSPQQVPMVFQVPAEL